MYIKYIIHMRTHDTYTRTIYAYTYTPENINFGVSFITLYFI